MESHRKLRKSSQVVQEIGSYVLGTYNVWLLSRRKAHDSVKYDRKDRGPITYCEVRMIVKIKLKYKTPVVYLETAFFFIARNHYHYHYYIIIFIIFSFYLFLSSFLLLLYFLNFFFLRKSFFSSFLIFIPILNVFSGLFSLLKLSQKTTTTTALFCLNVLQYIVPGTLNITQVLLATAVLR